MLLKKRICETLHRPMFEVEEWPSSELEHWSIFFSIDDNKDSPIMKQKTHENISIISLKQSGLKISEIAKELDRFADSIPEISKKSLEARLAIVEVKIKQNLTSMTGASSTGYLHSSVGQSSAFSKQGKDVILGTAGIYHMDSVSAKFGKTEKDLNAAQIAYWLEFGTSRLRSGKRKVRGVEYNEEDLIQMNARPVISNAFYTSMDEQSAEFKRVFNQLADKKKG